MPNYHMFKMKSGEMIIAQFHKIEEMNARTGSRCHVISKPMIHSNDEGYVDWLPEINFPHDTMPLPENDIMMWFEENVIDPIIIESYKFAIGEDD